MKNDAEVGPRLLKNVRVKSILWGFKTRERRRDRRRKGNLKRITKYRSFKSETKISIFRVTSALMKKSRRNGTKRHH